MLERISAKTENTESKLVRNAATYVQMLLKRRGRTLPLKNCKISVNKHYFGTQTSDISLEHRVTHKYSDLIREIAGIDGKS